jgi:hypothetical protein
VNGEWITYAAYLQALHTSSDTSFEGRADRLHYLIREQAIGTLAKEYQIEVSRDEVHKAEQASGLSEEFVRPLLLSQKLTTRLAEEGVEFDEAVRAYLSESRVVVFVRLHSSSLGWREIL